MKKKILFRAVKFIYLLCCLSIIVFPNDLKRKNTKYESLPKTELDMASDEEKEIYKNELDSLGNTVIKQHEGLTSLLVMKDGKLYLERYYNGNDKDTLFEVHSCTKTVIAILTGISYDQGMIGDENTSFLNLFHDLKLPEVKDGFKNIRLKDMLSMSSGINWDQYSGSFKIKMNIIANGIDYGLNLIPGANIIHKPGTNFNYDSNESRSLMAMVAYNSGMEDIDFLDKYLFGKLEIYNYMWPYNSSGLLSGGMDLFLCSRDLAKIGQLLLDKGVYKGEQIVASQWVEKMLAVTLENVECEDIKPQDILDYGYYMWHTKYKGYDVNFAYGKGGQYIFIVPKLNICVVTSAIDKDRYDNFRQIAYQVVDIVTGVK